MFKSALADVVSGTAVVAGTWYGNIFHDTYPYFVEIGTICGAIYVTHGAYLVCKNIVIGTWKIIKKFRTKV